MEKQPKNYDPDTKFKRGMVLMGLTFPIWLPLSVVMYTVGLPLIGAAVSYFGITLKIKEMRKNQKEI